MVKVKESKYRYICIYFTNDDSINNITNDEIGL